MSYTLAEGQRQTRQSLKKEGFQLRKIKQNCKENQAALWFLTAFLFLTGPVLRGDSAELKTEAAQVAVIGAGLAGLVTARELEKQGLDVQVFEASKRTGGRVHSVSFPDGSVGELGASNLQDGVSAEHILQLVSELGLETQTSYVTCRPKLFLLDGKVWSLPEIFQGAPIPDEKNHDILMKLPGTNLADIMDGFLGKRHTHLRQYIDRVIEHWEGNPPDQLDESYRESLFWGFYRDLYHRAVTAPDQKHLSTLRVVKGGNHRLIEALQKSLKHPIRFSSPLVKISQEKAGSDLYLKFGDDRVISAQRMVLAIPVTAFRALQWEGQLTIPEDQRQALEQQQMGTNSKMIFHVRFPESSNPDPLLASDKVIWFDNNFRVMTWYFPKRSPLAATDLSKEERLKRIKEAQKEIQQIYPDMQILDHWASQLWTQEPWIQGSYSSFAPNQRQWLFEEITEFGESVRKTYRNLNGQVFFAGEFTAPDGEYATMNGAVLSGQRAARQVTRSLGHNVYAKGN